MLRRGRGENQSDNEMGYVQDPELKVGEKKMCCIQDLEQDEHNCQPLTMIRVKSSLT